MRNLNRNKQRQDNRKNFPKISKIIDEFREVFGNVSPVFAEENGISIGRKVYFLNNEFVVNIMTKANDLVYSGVMSDNDVKKSLCERIMKYPKALYIELSKYSPKRSLPQNSKIHVWFYQISCRYKDIGINMTPRQVKIMLKAMFLGTYKFKTPSGTTIVDICHTSDLNKHQLSEFITNIVFWAEEELELYLN